MRLAKRSPAARCTTSSNEEFWEFASLREFTGQTNSVSEIDLTQPTINDLQAIPD
jgi:hypothetical protein